MPDEFLKEFRGSGVLDPSSWRGVLRYEGSQSWIRFVMGAQSLSSTESGCEGRLLGHHQAPVLQENLYWTS